MATTDERMTRKKYEKALRELQVELCALQCRNGASRKACG